jgi:hydroxypyruvate reductase
VREPSATPRGSLLDLYRRALAAVHGDAAVRSWLDRYPLSGPFHLIALGKAADAMAAGALAAAGEQLRSGLLVTRHGHLGGEVLRDPRLVCLEAGHPLPDEQSLAAGNALRLFLDQAPQDAEFLFLISGGTSSLVEVPVEGVTLQELRQLNLWLLGSGLPISAMNRVRAAVSRIKGGRLAAGLHGRHATVLLMSDVPGDVMSDIGSGLLLPSAYSALPVLPARLAELPMQMDAVSQSPDVDAYIVASNGHARRAAVSAARDAGHEAWDHGSLPETDAGRCGEAIARFLLTAEAGVHVWGGETTVKLPEHPGQGGRNQHLALAAARALTGREGIHLLSAGTDGSDGASDDAGALVDGGTLERGGDAGYDAADCLRCAASADFLEGSGDLLHTGPTGCNVMDLVIAWKE